MLDELAALERQVEVIRKRAAERAATKPAPAHSKDHDAHEQAFKGLEHHMRQLGLDSMARCEVLQIVRSKLPGVPNKVVVSSSSISPPSVPPPSPRSRSDNLNSPQRDRSDVRPAFPISVLVTGQVEVPAAPDPLVPSNVAQPAFRIHAESFQPSFFVPAPRERPPAPATATIPVLSPAPGELSHSHFSPRSPQTGPSPRNLAQSPRSPHPISPTLSVSPQSAVRLAESRAFSKAQEETRPGRSPPKPIPKPADRSHSFVEQSERAEGPPIRSSADTPGANFPLCPRCRKPVLNRGALHPECFTCSVCKCTLDCSYLEHNGQLYCRTDYMAHVAQPCGHCGQVVADILGVSAAGKFWHAECFVCTRCHLPLSPKTFVANGTSVLFCETCRNGKT